MLKVLSVSVLIFWAGPGWAKQATVLVFGDSLSAAYGIDPSQGWVALLQDRLIEQGYPYRVVNASVSGDTTSSGLTRIEPALKRHDPSIVIIELGANDGLRALSVESVRGNLARIIEAVQGQDRDILLIGMRIPPNYGQAYVSAFEAVYPSLAKSYRVQLTPFLLEHVAAVPGLIQADGVHPNVAAQPRILDNVWPHLLPLLDANGSLIHRWAGSKTWSKLLS